MLLINNNTQLQALLQQEKAMKPPTKQKFTVNKASFNGMNHIETERNGEGAKKATKTKESESSQFNLVNTFLKLLEEH